MIRACIVLFAMGLSSEASAAADDYDPHEMPGTYQYCLGQLDSTLRQIDWQSAADLVDERVLQARRHYERCLTDQSLSASNAPPVR